jgi:IMP cyclohydrolase
MIGVGKFESMPLVFFTLASKSLPYRELRINEKAEKIQVFPKRGYENHPTNQNPEIDCYSCIVTGRNQTRGYMVSFNGHMAKRTGYNLIDGMNPLMALDLTLLDFRGLKNDSRIGAIAYFSLQKKEESFWLGISDTDRNEKRIAGYPNNRHRDLENKLLFAYDRDTELEKSFKMDIRESNPNKIAEYIHKNVIGKEIIFGLGTGVALFDGKNFQLGVYNSDFDEAMVERWKGMMG